MWLFALINSVYLYMATMFQVLIPDGTKLFIRDRQTTLWTACVRCAHVGLINSNLYWHRTNELFEQQVLHPTRI